MAKLGKQPYFTRAGEKKINCYKVNIKKEIVEQAGIKDTDEIKVYTKDGKIIIEKI